MTCIVVGCTSDRGLVALGSTEPLDVGVMSMNPDQEQTSYTEPKTIKNN